MADGDATNDNTKNSAFGSQDTRAAEAFLTELQQPVVKLDATAPVGDTVAFNAGQDAAPYKFDVSSESAGVQERFGGTPQQNFEASQGHIQDVYAKVTTPEGKQMLDQAAAQMIEHFKTPGLDKAINT